jgi:nitrate reductase gamma subunit
MELLDFARGPALAIAFAIFAFGVAWRLSVMLFAPRLKERAPPREKHASHAKYFVQGVFSRFWPHKTFERATFTNHLMAYIFHIGLFIVVFLYRPHILFLESLIGVSWPALPNVVVYGVGMVTVGAMIVVIVRRWTNPVQRLLSTFNDWSSWAITLAPVLTGLALISGFFGVRYETLLAIHILSVCLLLIWIPFSKLMHTFTFIPARGMSAVRLKRRGTAF